MVTNTAKKNKEEETNIYFKDHIKHVHDIYTTLRIFSIAPHQRRKENPKRRK